MRKKRIAGIIVLAGLLVAGAVSVFLVTKAQMPKLRLTKGLVNLGRELSAYKNPVLSEAEFPKLWQKLQNGATHTVAEIDVSLPGREVSMLGLKLDKSTDRQNRLLKTVGEISLFEKEGLELEVAMDGKDLYLKLPGLSAKALKLDADSLFSKIIGWNIPEDYLKVIFGDFLEAEDDISKTVPSLLGGAFLAGTLGEENKGLKTKEEVQNFLAQVQMIDSGKEIVIENSFREIDWDGYTLNFPGETVSQLFTKLGQVMGSDQAVRFKDQLTLDIYLDQKDRIVRITTPEALIDLETGKKIEFTTDFLGEERTIDTMTMTLYVSEPLKTQEPKVTEVTLRWNGTPGQKGSSGTLLTEWNPLRSNSPQSEAGTLKLACAWDYLQKAFTLTGEQQKQGKNLHCEMKGNLLDILPGERVQINIETLQIAKEQKEICSITGTLMLEPLKEKIIMPESVGW